MQIQTHYGKNLQNISKQLEPLKLMTISKELSLQDGNDVFDVFTKNIDLFFDDFKMQFQEYLDKELITASNERMELIRIVRSELANIVWELRLIKMLDGEYKFFNEFLSVYQPKEYFGLEKSIVKYFEKKDIPELFMIILEQFKIIFENTNSAKYKNVDQWFEMFTRNLQEEFPNYCYICWERIICKLKSEKPLDFPCLNDILKTVDIYNKTFPIDKVRFLKKLKLID